MIVIDHSPLLLRRPSERLVTQIMFIPSTRRRRFISAKERLYCTNGVSLLNREIYLGPRYKSTPFKRFSWIQFLTTSLRLRPPGDVVFKNKQGTIRRRRQVGNAFHGDRQTFWNS